MHKEESKIYQLFVGQNHATLQFTYFFCDALTSPPASYSDYQDDSQTSKDLHSDSVKSEDGSNYDGLQPEFVKEYTGIKADDFHDESDYGQEQHIPDTPQNLRKPKSDVDSNYSTDYSEAKNNHQPSVHHKESFHSQKVRDDWEIPYQELEFMAEIGKGSYGVVFQAKWRGQDVAVKKLNGQNVTPEEKNEYLQEILLMKHLRPHGNGSFLLAFFEKKN